MDFDQLKDRVKKLRFALKQQEPSDQPYLTSEDIKQLAVAEEDREKSAIEPDDITVIENRDNPDSSQADSIDVVNIGGRTQDGLIQVSVSDSLNAVNKLLTEIDDDLANQLGDPIQDKNENDIVRDKSFDSIREEKSKKSISFRLNTIPRKYQSNIIIF